MKKLLLLIGAAIRRIPAATLAAVVFAALASSAFAHGWVDERAATTGQTGSWTEGVAYDPATQTADICAAALVEEYKSVAAQFKGKKKEEPAPEPTPEPDGNAPVS